MSPVWLHDRWEPVRDGDGGSALLGHLQSLLNHLLIMNMGMMMIAMRTIMVGLGHFGPLP